MTRGVWRFLTHEIEVVLPVWVWLVIFVSAFVTAVSYLTEFVVRYVF